MAYIPTYEISFTNENMNPVVITLSEKDGDADAVTNFDCYGAKLSYNGDEGRFPDIFGMSLEVEYFVRTDQSDPTPIFVQARRDTWQVSVTVDSKPFFYGYLLPDEGGTPFQDLPYNAKFTAVDGIGLLKDVQMEDGVFTSHHSIIEYVAYLLQKTGLQLPIRVRDNVYHSSFEDRNDDIAADFFPQAYLEHRTFEKDATSFTDCYNALETILKENYRLSQENGEWKITRLGMLQYVPFVVYETLYDYNGENPEGVEVTNNYATVGKNELIYPHGEDQIKYIKKAVKSSRLNYSYEVWPELPKNNKLERGTLLNTTTALDDIDEDGDGDYDEVIGQSKNYSIDNVTYGFKIHNTFPDPALNPSGSNPPIIRRIVNSLDVEMRREIALPFHHSSNILTGTACMMWEPFAVVAGVKLKIGFDVRTEHDTQDGSDDGIQSRVAIVYLATAGGNWFVLDGSTTSDRFGQWLEGSKFNTILHPTRGFVYVDFGLSNTRQYGSVSVETHPLPASGTLYIAFLNPDGGSNIDNESITPHGHTYYFRNFELEYIPMVAGGFQKVKGDYWNITQSADYIDKSENETFLSDNPHKVFKGCLLNSAGVPLTPDFYRLGINEHKAYRQIANHNRFNMEHRRMSMVEGSFTSLLLNPQNNQEEYYPVSLHWQYRETDMAGDVRFIISAPLEMDLVKGWLTARFWEVYDDNHLAFDGRTNGTEEQKYIF